MPYRQDQVIYPDLVNTANLDRTKSIRFSTYLPQIGDTVGLFQKTFNYSFVEIPPVEIPLYHVHPNEGGVLMTDIDGNTLLTTAEDLGIRGRVETEVKFVASFDMIDADFTKIYAVLDPNNLIDEIDDENNIGQAQLGYGCNQPGVSTNINELFVNGEKPYVLSTFPVPADQQLIIAYDMTQVRSKKAGVSVFDMVGKSIENFRVSPEFEGKIYWNTSNIDNGVYIINIWNENGMLDSEKVIIQH